MINNEYCEANNCIHYHDQKGLKMSNRSNHKKKDVGSVCKFESGGEEQSEIATSSYLLVYKGQNKRIILSRKRIGPS